MGDRKRKKKCVCVQDMAWAKNKTIYNAKELDFIVITITYL